MKKILFTLVFTLFYLPLCGFSQSDIHTPNKSEPAAFKLAKVYFLPDWSDKGMSFDGTDEKPCTEICPQKTSYDCASGQTETYTNSCGMTCTRCVECYGCDDFTLISCPADAYCGEACCNGLFRIEYCNSGYVLENGTCRAETCSDNPNICSGGKSCVSGTCQCPSGQTDVGGKCETSTCTNNGIKCSGSTGVCNTSTGKCVECLENSNCSGGKECNANNQCIVPADPCENVTCTNGTCSGGACQCNNGFQKLDDTTCVECTQDSHCKNGEKCNKNTNTCEANVHSECYKTLTAKGYLVAESAEELLEIVSNPNNGTGIDTVNLYILGNIIVDSLEIPFMNMNLYDGRYVLNEKLCTPPTGSSEYIALEFGVLTVTNKMSFLMPFIVTSYLTNYDINTLTFGYGPLPINQLSFHASKDDTDFGRIGLLAMENSNSVLNFGESVPDSPFEETSGIMPLIDIGTLEASCQVNFNEAIVEVDNLKFSGDKLNFQKGHINIENMSVTGVQTLNIEAHDNPASVSIGSMSLDNCNANISVFDEAQVSVGKIASLKATNSAVQLTVQTGGKFFADNETEMVFQPKLTYSVYMSDFDRETCIGFWGDYLHDESCCMPKEMDRIGDHYVSGREILKVDYEEVNKYNRPCGIEDWYAPDYPSDKDAWQGQTYYSLNQCLSYKIDLQNSQ